MSYFRKLIAKVRQRQALLRGEFIVANLMSFLVLSVVMNMIGFYLFRQTLDVQLWLAWELGLSLVSFVSALYLVALRFKDIYVPWYFCFMILVPALNIIFGLMAVLLSSERADGLWGPGEDSKVNDAEVIEGELVS